MAPYILLIKIKTYETLPNRWLQTLTVHKMMSKFIPSSLTWSPSYLTLESLSLECKVSGEILKWCCTMHQSQDTWAWKISLHAQDKDKIKLYKLYRSATITNVMRLYKYKFDPNIYIRSVKSIFPARKYNTPALSSHQLVYIKTQNRLKRV